MPSRLRLVIPFVACALLQAAVGTAQPAPHADYVATAIRVEDRANVDGALDEPFWREIPPITGFVQREPGDGAPATERTEVRIACNRDFLYFGITLFDSEPGRITKSLLRGMPEAIAEGHVA